MPAYKDKDRGTWYVKYSYTDRVTGKRKQVLKRGFPTKREASLWEAQQRSNEVQSTSITFRALMGKYHDFRKSRQKTREDQTRMMELHFPLIDEQIDKITKQQMAEWYTDLIGRSLSIGTINLILTVLKGIFKFGEDFYELPNYSSSLKRLRAPKRKYNVWDIDEFNQFIQFEESALYSAAFSFLYTVGVRSGELLGLQYTDFANGKVHIHQQMTKYGLAPLKTENAERTLKLPDAVQAQIKPILEGCSEEQPFVFPIPKVTLRDHFKRAIQASGVTDIRIHDLRHSFATNAICSGASIVAVSKYLGHSSITITLNTYTHLLEKTDDEMIEIMNDLYKNL